MSSSYGHAIQPIGGSLESGKAFHHTQTTVEQRPSWRDPSVLVWNPSCSAPKCREKPEFVTRYLYVTGRRGRVSDAIRYVCKAHGERFAKKNGLALPGGHS